MDDDNDFDSGIFLIDKPVGITSFGMVKRVRGALGIKKVGHSGTLDPFASGLLIICAGRPATKIIDTLMVGVKEYEATLKLGIATDTQDLEGRVVAERPVGVLDRERVLACLRRFEGEQLQVPPQYSALKHEGKPLYYYARKGVEVVKEARRVEISALQCLEIGLDTITIRVTCSKGTYIRTLAADIGEALGCGAHLIALRRLRNGIFAVADALAGEELADRQGARERLLPHRLTVAEVLARVAAEPSA